MIHISCILFVGRHNSTVLHSRGHTYNWAPALPNPFSKFYHPFCQWTVLPAVEAKSTPTILRFGRFHLPWWNRPGGGWSGMFVPRGFGPKQGRSIYATNITIIASVAFISLRCKIDLRRECFVFAARWTWFSYIGAQAKEGLAPADEGQRFVGFCWICGKGARDRELGNSGAHGSLSNAEEGREVQASSSPEGCDEESGEEREMWGLISRSSASFIVTATATAAATR